MPISTCDCISPARNRGLTCTALNSIGCRKCPAGVTAWPPSGRRGVGGALRAGQRQAFGDGNAAAGPQARHPAALGAAEAWRPSPSASPSSPPRPWTTCCRRSGWPGMRRGIWIDTYTPDYGQYAQELMNPGSGLHQFRPDTVLFALDAHHLMQGVEAGQRRRFRAASARGRAGRSRRSVGRGPAGFLLPVIQTVPLPVFAPLLGNNDHRLPWSRAAALRRFSAMLRERADAAGVDLIALDDRAAADGLSPGMTRRSGIAPSRRSTRRPRRSTATWSAGWSRPRRAGPASAWCSTSTTRSGAG